MEDSMAVRRGILPTAVGALMLRDETFHSIRDETGPFLRGLVFVLVVGLILALAGVVGAALTEWTSPDLDALRDAIVTGLDGMPWKKEIPAADLPEVESQIQRSVDIAFEIAGAVTPNLPRALAGIVLTPLAMVIGWLLLGVIVFVVARILEGEGSLAQTYGGLALAAAPQLLGVVHIIPYVQAAGLGLWSIVVAYLAVKHVHGLSANRAFWVLLVSLACAFVLVAIMSVGVGAIVALTLFAGGGAG